MHASVRDSIIQAGIRSASKHRICHKGRHRYRECICACPTAFFAGRPGSQVIDKHLPATSLITALEVPLHQENLDLDLDLEPPFDQPRNVAYRGIFRSKVSDSVNCNTKKKLHCMYACTTSRRRRHLSLIVRTTNRCTQLVTESNIQCSRLV
jgi:hypothetical protein